MTQTPADPTIITLQRQVETLQQTYPDSAPVASYVREMAGRRADYEALLLELNKAEQLADDYRYHLALAERDLARVDLALPDPSQARDVSVKRHEMLSLVEDLRRWLALAITQQLEPAQHRYADVRKGYLYQLSQWTRVEVQALQLKPNRTTAETLQLYQLERAQEAAARFEAHERQADRDQR